MMNHSDTLISICIPAYKRLENLNKLLYSISIQTFQNYEIVITDDSPDDSLQEVIQKYSQLNINYHKNEKAQGTPANWNTAIARAKGEWIKIIHDDDWFANEKSLEAFAEATKQGKKFIFSAYKNVFQDSNKTELKEFPAGRRAAVLENPVLLLAENVIGPPSVTLVHRSVTEQYDTLMKWRVDIDFYIRVLKDQKDFYSINTPLINVGISESQVTNSCLNVPDVELPEGLLLLLKYGTKPLKNILVYDAWWRIIRNVGVRSKDQLVSFTPYKQWPSVILKMVEQQSKVSTSLLKKGVLSKFFMTLSYLSNYRFLNS